MALTPKQKRFANEYPIDLNATQAAIRAGYSPKRASEIGYQLLRKTTVAEAIDETIRQMEDRTKVTQDRVISELAKIAFANGSDFAEVVTGEHPEVVDGEVVTVNGQYVKMKDTGKVPEDKKAAIAGIKQGRNGIEVSSYDKLKALELLGKHLGIFDRKEEKDEGGVQIIDDL